MREPKIYEISGGFGFRLDIGIDPVTGKRKQKRFGPFRTKTETRRMMALKMNEIETGVFVNPNNVRLGEFLMQWLEHKRKHVAAGTYSHYKPYVKNHLIPNLGNIKIDQLKPAHIQELYDGYIEEEILSNQSILHMHRILNNAYNKAIEWELAIKNPCTVISPPKPEKFQMKAWDELDVRLFLDDSNKKRFFIVYLLALTTGMRKGEILGLRWQDIDFTNSYLSVQQAVTKKKGGGYELGKLKTDHAYRTLSLDEHVLEFLRRHKQEQMEYKMKSRKTYKDQDLLIANSNGSFILPRNLDREWIKDLNQSMLRKIRFHDMRHTHATLLLKQGVHPKVVQERLGHYSITVTLDLYSHVLPNIQKAAAEQFGSQIFGEKNKNKYSS